MKYFLISEDKKLIDRPQLMNWYQKIEIEKLKWGTYHQVSERSVIFVKGNKDIYFADILTFPFQMVSKKVKDILDLYEPNMGYRQVILIEQEHEQMMQYFVPHLMRVDCLGKSTKYNFDHSELVRAVLEKDKIPDKCIFEVEKVSNRQIIVRHDFLESLLRREVIFDFKEIEIEEK